MKLVAASFQEEMIAVVPELREAYADFEWRHLRTVCVEAPLPPLRVELGQDRTRYVRLAQILSWIGGVVADTDKERRNIVAGSVCQPLITTHSDRLSPRVPLTGRETRRFCKMQFTAFKIDP